MARLFYLEAPAMLSSTMGEIIAYNPEAMAQGSMWWWVLALAPGVPEALIVGHEGAFLAWFYDGATARREAIDDDAAAEYLRTFTGVEGVLGALGVYRAAFATIEQTTPLTTAKVRVPVVALGGDAGQDDHVREMVELVASDVTGGTVPDCGHFLPEERPDELAQRIMSAIPRRQGPPPRTR